jgi:hypothetical protein
MKASMKRSAGPLRDGSARSSSMIAETFGPKGPRISLSLDAG